MKVLDLRCGIGHGFEGWFASEEDYHSQCERGLLDCPVCGNADVVRLPSAPRLNLSGARAPAAEAAGRAAPETSPSATAANASPARPETAAAAPATTMNGTAASRFVQAVAELLKNTEDVGTRFAEEARRIHYGESQAKAIRGQATPAEREALAEEGIDVLSLPPLPVPKGSLQ